MRCASALVALHASDATAAAVRSPAVGGVLAAASSANVTIRTVGEPAARITVCGLRPRSGTPTMR
jgi:acetyl-CoA carboxylase beta subunit